MDAEIPDLERERVYDHVVDVYERVNVPRFFAEPGRVLAESVAPPPGARALDIGAGTGAVARALGERAGDGALVVAADASTAMLRAAQRAGLGDCVTAMLPDLPFAPDSFDIVTSAFVMTHLDDADLAAREMKRVLRPGGRIGLSAWYRAAHDAESEWSRVVAGHVDPARIQDALRRILPGDERFAQPGSLADLLAGAGFEDIVARDHCVECAMTVDEYVASRSVSATGRALQSLLSGTDWRRLREAAEKALRGRFPDLVRFPNRFHVAVGARPR